MNTSHRKALLKGIAITAFAAILSNDRAPALYADAQEETKTLRVALAQLKHPNTVAAGVKKIKGVLAECRKEQVDVVCFPETYLPGLRGGREQLPPPDQDSMEQALHEIRESCGVNKVAAIVGMEWKSKLGLENRAFVISAGGKLLGYQTKNQITPGGESKNYVPDGKRRNFKIRGVVIGVVICHEGWRYPETVRWAAVRGAKVVFQPQVTGSDRPGKPSRTDRKWGSSFYEKAMQCRSEENSIYFASVNQAMTRQNSATSLIGPDGEMVKHAPYGEETLLIADLDLRKATGFYASRYRAGDYQDQARQDDP